MLIYYIKYYVLHKLFSPTTNNNDGKSTTKKGYVILYIYIYIYICCKVYY